MHRRPVYIYFLNVPSFSSRYFNKIKRTSRLGRLLALSLEILYQFNTDVYILLRGLGEETLTNVFLSEALVLTGQ